MENNPI